MTQVLQQRCLPTDMAQQPYAAHTFRTNNPPADQSTGEVASRTGGLSAASDVDRLSTSGSPLPTFDLAPMLALERGDDRSEAVEQLCQAVATCLRDTGCLVISDPRVKAEDNMAFLDMMERYFAQSTAAKMQDTRPELHFQVSTKLPPNQALGVQRMYTCTRVMDTSAKNAGPCVTVHVEGTSMQLVLPLLASSQRHCRRTLLTHSAGTGTKPVSAVIQVGATPEGTETPKCTVDPTSIASIHSQPAEHRARIPQGADPKWRYMWRIGERPAHTRYAELNAEPVVPASALLAGSFAQPVTVTIKRCCTPPVHVIEMPRTSQRVP